MKKTIAYQNEFAVSYAEYGRGNGFPVLINHGLIASIDDHELFNRLLQIGARLICIARPGYGDSSPYEMRNIGGWADVAAAVIDELGLSRFDVLGMSSGAPYSYAIGYRFPDRVRNIYIFSGIPALYDKEILSHWPYRVTKDASVAEMEKLAYELFFSHLSQADLAKNDIRDSMRNRCFGIAQDLRLRCRDWGFRLNRLSANVYMQHSQEDESVPFVTAMLTSKLLPHCKFDAKEHGEHFSAKALDDFIGHIIAPTFNHEESMFS